MKSHQTPTIWFASLVNTADTRHNNIHLKHFINVSLVPMSPGTRTDLGCRGCVARHQAEADRDRGQRNQGDIYKMLQVNVVVSFVPVLTQAQTISWVFGGSSYQLGYPSDFRPNFLFYL
jgi:hypothetical protein